MYVLSKKFFVIRYVIRTFIIIYYLFMYKNNLLPLDADMNSKKTYYLKNNYVFK